MTVHMNLDSRLRWAKDGSIIAEPVEVHVTHFTQGAVAKFREELDRAVMSGQSVVPVWIDSYGGSAHSLLALIDAMDSVRDSVSIATIATGRAMSAGAALLCCGDEGLRFCSPGATLLVHEVSSFSVGKSVDIQSDARETGRLNSLVLGHMDKRCGHPSGYFSDLIHANGHADVYLTPKQALKHRMCNVIGLPHLAVVAQVDYLFGLPHPPRAHKHSAACGHAKPSKKKAAKS